MDPNETLRCLRSLARQTLRDADADSNHVSDNQVHMANIFEALDEWLMKGGFLPSDWSKARKNVK